MNIKHLEIKPASPSLEEEKLSDSYQFYLKTRQEKLAEAKMKMQYASPLSSHMQTRNFFNNTVNAEAVADFWESSDDSFIAQEKICRDLSIPLINLNESSVGDLSVENEMITKMLRNNAKKSEALENNFNMTGDMTLLGEIEEPSFMRQHNSLFKNSPIKHSPFANRPSTIAEEESIISGKNVSVESYRSAFTRPQSSESDTFKTANEDSISGISCIHFKTIINNNFKIS